MKLLAMIHIDFSPLSLFDGVRETPWCESVKGDGLGQWVGFKILKDLRGLEIQNGFMKSLYEIDGKNLHTFYEKNNRVKKLKIVSEDKRINISIDLKDVKTLQYFHKFLPKGFYKLYIKEVYKGSKWDDTCLGEIKFYLNEPGINRVVLNDEFIKQLGVKLFD